MIVFSLTRSSDPTPLLSVTSTGSQDITPHDDVITGGFVEFDDVTRVIDDVTRVFDGVTRVFNGVCMRVIEDVRLCDDRAEVDDVTRVAV